MYGGSPALVIWFQIVVRESNCREYLLYGLTSRNKGPLHLGLSTDNTLMDLDIWSHGETQRQLDLSCSPLVPPGRY